MAGDRVIVAGRQSDLETVHRCWWTLWYHRTGWGKRDLLYKSYNAPVSYPTMHHFVTEMCTYLLQNGTLWDTCTLVKCIVGFVKQVYCVRQRLSVRLSIQDTSECVMGFLQYCSLLLIELHDIESVIHIFITHAPLFRGDVAYVYKSPLGDSYLVMNIHNPFVHCVMSQYVFKPCDVIMLNNRISVATITYTTPSPCCVPLNGMFH